MKNKMVEIDETRLQTLLRIEEDYHALISLKKKKGKRYQNILELIAFDKWAMGNDPFYKDIKRAYYEEKKYSEGNI